ncbi:hypothetical protein Tco_1166749 [Tanacetum coccineum]
MTESPLMDSGLVVPVFSSGYDPIACLNKEMTFLTAVASLMSNATSSRGNNASRQAILSEDFGKRFVPQQELSAEQTFWYHMLNPSTKSSDASPVKMEAPKELPKVSLVNESLKKLKFHLAKFENVVVRNTKSIGHFQYS